jgi:hypothetical protein
MEGSFVTVAEFDRHVAAMREAEARVWATTERISRTLEEIAVAQALRDERDKKADERDKAYRNRVFLVTLAVLAAFLAVVTPALFELVTAVV